MDATFPEQALEGPLAAYRAKLQAGELQTDPAQALLAERLQDLWQRLRGYDPPLRPAEGGLLERILRPLRASNGAGRPPPQGLYIVGEVGRGKSMLMGLFFASAEVTRKRRIHFHAFMQEVHGQFHALKRNHPEIGDPIPLLAHIIAEGASLLCFDEFQINDIADAMILYRLFEALFSRGVVVVATSNTAPENLFRDQPGRDALLPFIALLKRHLEVLVLEGKRDWRRGRLKTLPTWFVPANAEAEAALSTIFAELAEGAPPRPRRLSVLGRELEIPLAAGPVARFDFAALCARPLGAADYLALATHFPALIVERIPQLLPEQSQEARRFITFIDALYEHRVKLYASAAAPPDALYPSGEEAAMFTRTASRLMEMQSEQYLALPHLT